MRVLEISTVYNTNTTNNSINQYNSAPSLHENYNYYDKPFVQWIIKLLA